MEQRNHYDGLHPAAISAIHYHARKLHVRNAVPGMEVEDYQQHLALQLSRRSRSFDDRRSSYATFADRVVRSQAASLASPTTTRAYERQTISLDELVPIGDDDNEASFHDLISVSASLLSPSDATDLRVDFSRFVATLPPALRRCLRWIVEGGVQAAVRDGFHRSSFYEACERLRARALAHGLAEYL